MFMLRAAQPLSEPDPEWSRECFLDALEMSLVVGRASGVMDMVLAAAQSAAPAPRSPDALDALIRLAAEGHRAAVPRLRKVLDGDDTPMWTRRPALAVMLAAELWDPHAHMAITEWLMKTGRESGSPLLLRLGLAQLTSCAVLSGLVQCPAARQSARQSARIRIASSPRGPGPPEAARGFHAPPNMTRYRSG